MAWLTIGTDPANRGPRGSRLPPFFFALPHFGYRSEQLAQD